MLIDAVAEVLELLRNLSDEDRKTVLRHFHDDLVAATEEYCLPGGGMSSGSMTLVDEDGAYGTPPGRDARSERRAYSDPPRRPR